VKADPFGLLAITVLQL